MPSTLFVQMRVKQEPRILLSYLGLEKSLGFGKGEAVKPVKGRATLWAGGKVSEKWYLNNNRQEAQGKTGTMWLLDDTSLSIPEISTVYENDFQNYSTSSIPPCSSKYHRVLFPGRRNFRDFHSRHCHIFCW